MGQTTVLSLTITVLALLAAGLAAMLYALLRQQGRLLLRLDQVERRLGLDTEAAIARGTVAIQARNPAGLPVGTALPDFQLPDLGAHPVTLAGFRGRRVLLIHWSARCGFCDMIAPDLVELAPDLARAGVQLLLVSGGSAEAERESAREYGLRCPILLQAGEDLEAFAHVGTPAAYLLDTEGRVARPLALGADQVPVLAREAISQSPGKRRLPGERPLAESRIERNGLAAGTPAPDFELPEVRGGTVSLAEHRGRRVLLVFSDPHCGPCGQLAPQLVRLHEENPGLDLLLISRGDLHESRETAKAQGFEFPVAVQRRWELSRRYGIFAAPVAFLIAEDGRIAQNVARGIDEILALAGAPATRREVAHV
jgi:peroxiredoxin